MDLSSDSGATASKAATDKAFTTYDIQACLYDARRVHYLRDAIEQVVKSKPGAVVVDAGSGTGLLGMFAARAGAEKVYCIELNPEFISVIEENARRNGLSDKIIAVNADATSCGLPEDVDVVISEVISAGFFYEPQLQITNNLRRFLKPDGVMVPMLMNNHVELIHAQAELYGFTFDYDSRFADLEGDQSLSTRARYLETDFKDEAGTEISCQVQVLATHNAFTNAIKVSYDIQFGEGIFGDKPTEFLLNPQIIYLRERVWLEAGRSYDVALAYKASDNPLACEIEISPVADR